MARRFFDAQAARPPAEDPGVPCPRCGTGRFLENLVGILCQGCGYGVESLPVLSTAERRSKSYAFAIREWKEKRLHRIQVNGCTVIAVIEPVRFQHWFEEKKRTPLAWSPERMDRLVFVTTLNDYPRLGMDATGLSVLNGRHRIATAAIRRMPVLVAIQPGTMLPEGVLISIRKPTR